MSEIEHIRLDEDLGTFVASKVAQGAYGSASDVVSAGLRLLERQEAALRAALVDGEESGEPAPFDFETFIAQKRAFTRR